MPWSESTITRKQFIRTTGLAALMANSAITFLSKAFGQPAFDNNFLEKLNVNGIYPDPEHIGRAGIHLRWLFPVNLGFPDSFDIYRCEEKNCLAGEYIKYDAFGGHGRIEKTEKSIYILLNKSTGYLRISFPGEKPFSVKAFTGDKLLEVKTVINEGSLQVEFQHPEIDGFSFPADQGKFEYIVIDKSTEAQNPCDITGWQKIHTIDYKLRFINFDIGNFLEKCFNFYLPKEGTGRNKALARYNTNLQNNSYRSLVKGLSRSTWPSVEDQDFTNRKNKLFNIFFLSIIDPNIAQILGLYFIDEKIDSQVKYSYRIKANYAGMSPSCGTVYNLGGEYDALPVVSPIRVSQFDESFFQFNKSLTDYEQHGATQIKWKKQSYALKTDAVSYFLTKNPEKKLQILLNSQPKVDNTYIFNNQKGLLILPIGDREDKTTYVYSDRQVMIEAKAYEIEYSLFGIDSYGRVGDRVINNIKISDKNKPPAPVNLNIIERGPDEMKKYFLRFTYGASQYLKSPDADRFTLFKKEINGATRQEINYQVTDNSEGFRNPDSGNNLFIIRIEGFELRDLRGNTIHSPQTDTNEFRYKYFQPSKDNSNKKFALKDRVRYMIKRILDERTFEIETSRNAITALPAGIGYLYADQRNPAFWSPTGIEINFVPPVHLPIAAQTNGSITSKEITAKIKLAQKIVLPIYDDAEGNSKTKKYTRLIVDRAIFQSALFNNGKLRTKNNQTYPIKAQSSYLTTRYAVTNEELRVMGIGREDIFASQILIEGHWAFDLNQEIYISPEPETVENPLPLNNIKGIVKLLFKPGVSSFVGEGELLVPAIRRYYPSGNPDSNGNGPVTANTILSERIPITAKLLSDIKSAGNSLPAEALAYISKPVYKIISESSTAFYFKTYEAGITPHTDLNIPDGKGTASVSFAALTIDNSDNQNKSGLSLQVQHLDYLSVAPARPPAVYSCFPAIDGKNYLPLPNKEGRSSLCLQWDKLPDNQHPPSTRFELTRALDVSILSSLKARWMSDLMTSLENISLMLGTIEKSSAINISSLQKNARTGIYEGILATDSLLNDEDRKKFTGARVKINSIYFCATGFIGTKILLRLLTVSRSPDIPVSGVSDLVLEKIPDQAILTILADDSKLQEIADACPEAFSMVTKVPVRCNPCTPKPDDPGKKIIQYIDNVPGSGKSRYFYKVRSVDAAENRSEWSPCSEPFYQVDTRIIEQVSIIKNSQAGNNFFIHWINRDDTLKYLVFRAFDDETSSLLDEQPYKELTSLDAPPIRFVQGGIDIKYVAELTDEAIKSNLQLVSINAFTLNGEKDETNNYLVSEDTKIENRVIGPVNYGMTGTDELVIDFLTKDNIAIVSADSSNSPLVVKSRNLIITSSIEITEILGIYLTSAFIPSRFPLFDQTARNYLQGSGFVINRDNPETKYILSGLSADLNNQMVTLVVKSKMRCEVTKTMDTGEPLKISEGSIFLYKNTAFSIAGVYKSSEFNFDVTPYTNQTVQNYFNATSNFDFNTMRVERLLPGLIAGEKLVVVISYSDGLNMRYNRLATNQITGESIRALNDSIDLNWLANIEKIETIYTVNEALNNPVPFNYVLFKTSVDTNNKSILNPNPHLNEDQSVSLTFRKANGELVMLERLASLIELQDPIDREYSKVTYSIFAYKTLNAAMLQTMRIKSKPATVLFRK